MVEPQLRLREDNGAALRLVKRRVARQRGGVVLEDVPQCHVMIQDHRARRVATVAVVRLLHHREQRWHLRRGVVPGPV